MQNEEPFVDPDEAAPSSGSRLDDAADANPGSLAAQLRKKHKDLSVDSRSFDCEIPGYGGALVARYKPIEWSLLKKLAKKVEKSRDERKELYAHADTLIRSCEEIFGKDSDGKLVPLYKVFTELEDEIPVRYDDQLAKALGIQGDTARKVLLQVFSNDIAVTAHHNEVTEWMQDTSPEDDQDF